MDITVCTGTVAPMLDHLRDLKGGKARRAQLEALFAHPDYDFEFRRYQIPEKGPIVDYFMALPTIGQADIPLLHPAREQMLRWKHPRWLAAYENPGRYEDVLAAVNKSLSHKALEAIMGRVRRGMPQGIDLSRIRVIFTMSIGTSFGYVHEDALHVDLMGLEADSMDILPALLAHEIHHIAFLRHISAFEAGLTQAERYILGFAGEGLALKFCNNAQGARSRAIDPGSPVNVALDSFSMEYLNARFGEAVEVFWDTLALIEAGRMSAAGVDEQIKTYWLSFLAQGQAPGEQPKLKQSLLYSFGNDLFGSIYDVYGPETLFDCLRYPLKAARLLEELMG